MSVILLLLLFAIWMASSPDQVMYEPSSLVTDAILFVAGYVILILAVGLWSRRLARRVTGVHIVRNTRRFNWVISASQVFIPAWLSAGVFALGWCRSVQSMLGPVAHWPIELPGLLLGLSPSLLAWVGLWWAQFPVDRALREQNLLTRLDSDLPISAPPSFGQYFLSKLRMQLLFTIAPIVMIVAIRDIAGLTLQLFHIEHALGAIDLLVSAGAALLVFLIAPEVLRRVLVTESLPDPVLRQRLDVISNRAGVRCRDVLLWHTHHTVGNAAVMGLLPRFRYVLLSDLLVESLPDEQIAAVFAHEVGHIRHRHMVWYVLFFIGLSFGFVGLEAAATTFSHHFKLSTDWIGQSFPFVSLGALVICFGYVSRRFERQADVYAARTMEAITGAGDPTAQFAQQESRAVPARSGARRPGSPAHNADVTPVGALGARIFNQALLRVMDVNNIPLGTRGRFAGSLRDRLGFAIEWFASLAGSWLHGTMASRMAYITHISHDAALTASFDRRMKRIRAGLIATLLACTAWAGVSTYCDQSPAPTGGGEAMTTAVTPVHTPAAR